MPYIAYREQRFNSKAALTIKQAKVIIEDLASQGYVLTLRQLYYQMVSQNLIKNEEQAYKRLGRIITDARECGLIDWYHIEDRGRAAYFHPNVPTAEDVLKGIENALRIDPWLDQSHYVEVWVEKAALEGVIERPATRWRAPYMACKGYLSASEAWRAGRRFEAAIARGKKPVLFHLGDHDPSGLHMTVDNSTRLSLFARQGVHVQRLALNMDQVEQYGPPPNPAKQNDTRYAGYAAEFGDESWELDALSPKVIDGLVSDALEGLVDKTLWQKSLDTEKERRAPLARLMGRWDEVSQLVMSEERPLDSLKALDEVLYASQSLLQVSFPAAAERLALASQKVQWSAWVEPAPEGDEDPEHHPDEYEPDVPMPDGYEEN